MADETSPLLSRQQCVPTSLPAAPYTTPSAVTVVREVDTNGAEEENGNAIELNESYDAKPKNRMLTILLPLAIGVFLAAMDGTIVASSYASIGSDFKQLQNTSWIATGYMLTLTSFQPLYGKLSDIFGRKACLLFAYTVFGLGCLACGLARNMTELIAARVFTGVGGGGMTTVVSILVSDLVPLRQRGTWQGLLNIIFAMGSASGAPLGGIIADSLSWRWAFLLQIPFTVVAFTSVLLALHPSSSAISNLPMASKLRRIDFLGAFTLVIAVFSLLLGLDRGSNTRWSSKYSYIPLIISFIFSFAFAIVETTPALAREPFAPKRIIANAGLLGSYLTNFFGFAAIMCVVFHVSLYAQAVHRRSATGAGTILIPGILGGVSGSLIAGLVMQRTGKYKRLTVGSTLSIVAGTGLIDGMAMASFSERLAGVTIGLVVMNFGNGIAVTTCLIALIANVTAADQAIATAVSYLFRSLGSVIGISVGSALVQNTLRVHLTRHLRGPSHDIDEIVRRVRESLSFIDTLDPTMRVIVKASYERALLTAFWFGTAMGVGALVASVFVRENSLERTAGGGPK